MLFYIIMDFYNSALFLIIFVVLFTTFYIILSNFGYSVSFNTTNPRIEETITNIQSKVSELDKKVENKSEIPLTERNKYILVDDDTDSEYDTIMSLKSELNSYKKLLKQKNNNISKLRKKSKNINNNLNNEFRSEINDDDDDDDVEIVVNKTNESKPCQKRNVFVDPVANYDNAKLGDPLVDPLQRTSADQIPNPSIAMQFNFPTQGVLDKYHRVGLLIAIDSELDSQSNSRSNKSNYSENSNIVRTKSKNKPIIEEGQEPKRDYKGVWLAEHGKIEGFGNITADYDNSILELIGKRRYHNVYRYFTSITMGNKIIKVMVHNKNNKELYSGDIIFIKELGKNYRVEIDNMDMIEYNPYVV